MPISARTNAVTAARFQRFFGCYQVARAGALEVGSLHPVHPHVAVTRQTTLHPLLADQVALGTRFFAARRTHALFVMMFPPPRITAFGCFTVTEFVTLASLHEVRSVPPPAALTMRHCSRCFGWTRPIPLNGVDVGRLRRGRRILLGCRGRMAAWTKLGGSHVWRSTGRTTQAASPDAPPLLPAQPPWITVPQRHVPERQPS